MSALGGKAENIYSQRVFPVLTDAVEKCPHLIGFVIGEAFLAYSWRGVTA
jgi:hypothetical protein